MLTFSLPLNLTKMSLYLSVLYALALLIHPPLNPDRNSVIVPRPSSALIASITSTELSLRDDEAARRNVPRFIFIDAKGPH